MPEVRIIKATPTDYPSIAGIGKIAVAEAHRDSCSRESMDEFISNNYNDEAIINELANSNNIYHLIQVDDQPAGFSKIVLNAGHENIPQKNIAKLDRIYLLKEFFDLKLGYQLLAFNIDVCRKNNQAGMWLFTWTGNKRAVNFYHKTGFKIIGNHEFKVTETHYNENYLMFLDLMET